MKYEKPKLEPLQNNSAFGMCYTGKYFCAPICYHGSGRSGVDRICLKRRSKNANDRIGCQAGD